MAAQEEPVPVSSDPSPAPQAPTEEKPTTEPAVPEVWADIPGFVGYQASTLGRVRSRHKPGRGKTLADSYHVIRQKVDKMGYVRTCLYDGITSHTAHVHRLVLLSFVGRPKGDLRGRHLNGVKTDNRLINLAWGTAKENAEDRAAHRRGETVVGPRTPLAPPLRKHPSRDEARCWVAGKWVYMGKWGSEQSIKAYERLCAELRAASPEVVAAKRRIESVMVAEIVVAFLGYARKHYRRPDGTMTTEVREYAAVLEPVVDLYGDVEAAKFGPIALEAVRQELVRRKWCRLRINRQIGRVRRMFRWAASRELAPNAVYLSLCSVQGLQRGRSEAVESEPVMPVPVADVDLTLPHLNRHVRAMVRLMLATGMRPGEVCQLRWEEIDRSGPVWTWRVDGHKMAYAGRSRTIFFGPQAAKVITDFVSEGPVPPPGEAIFSPLRARAERFALMRAARKSKVPPSQRDRSVRNPDRLPARAYSPNSLVQAVAVAAEKAGVAHWHPSQLRHTFATAIRKAYGLEAAQVLLGHSRADVTQVYAERDISLALKVVGEIG